METVNNFMKVVCADCKTEFDYSDKEFRRQSKRGRNQFFCSLSCSRKFLNRTRPKTEGQLEASRRNLPKEQKKFSYYLSRAKRRGDTDLTHEFLKSLWESQNSRCALTGVELKHRDQLTKLRPDTASLDRIDSSKGYARDNVQFVAYSINLAKNKFSNEEFVDFLEGVKSAKSS